MEKFTLPKIYDNCGDLATRWFVGYYYQHPETNKKIKFRSWISSKLGTRAARYLKANEIKTELTIKLKSGFNPFETVERNYNLKQAFTQILEIKKVSTGTRTNSTYKSISNIFLMWIDKQKFNSLNVNEFNKHHAQTFLDWCLISKQISNRTYNNYLVAMRTLFECFFERDYINTNVWKKIKKLPTKQSALNFYTPAEREFIKTTLPNEHYPLYSIAMIIYYCFLRPAEIVRLQVKDVDFIKNQIIIPGSKSKNGKTQIVIMHPNLVNILKGLHLANYPYDFYIFATTKRLLPNSTQIAPTRIADAWRWLVKEKHGINKNIYDLKPTGASSAFESGIDARQIQLQIRHASLDQTQIYLDKISNHAGAVFREKMPSF